MASRSNFAAPLLLAVVTGLIVYVSLVSVPVRGSRTDTRRSAAGADVGARVARRHVQQRAAVRAVRLLRRAADRAALGTIAGIAAGALAGAALSLGLELLQASVTPRVSSLTDLSLNAAGALLGAILGSGFHALGQSMAPQATARARSREGRLRDLRALVHRAALAADPRSRLAPVEIRRAAAADSALSNGCELAGFFVGWLVVAQAVFHMRRRQRSVDVLLIVIATVLVGRTFIAGNVLSAAEIAAIALLLPVLVLLSRLDDRTRCGRGCVAARHRGSHGRQRGHC